MTIASVNAGNLTDWKYATQHVYSDVTGDQFVSAERTLLLVGPPSLSQLGNNDTDFSTDDMGNSAQLYPIAVRGSYQFGNSKNNLRIFEVGAMKAYIMPTKVIGTLTLNSTLVHGPSLLKALRAHYYNNTNGLADDLVTELNATRSSYLLGTLNDLLSTMPVGLAVLMRDSKGTTYGGMYFEDVQVSASMIMSDASSVVIQENITADFGAAVPLTLAAQ